jgi:hypothetical protein
MKKLVIAAAALVATVSLSGIAEAGWRHHRDWDGYNRHWDGYRHHYHGYRHHWDRYSEVYVQPNCESDYGDY